MVMIYANDLMIVLITGAHKLLMKQEEHLQSLVSKGANIDAWISFTGHSRVKLSEEAVYGGLQAKTGSVRGKDLCHSNFQREKCEREFSL